MKILNVSRDNLASGHYKRLENAVLIQITDVCGYLPTPKFPGDFISTHQFRFQDTETRWDDGVIAEDQAKDIASILVNAKKNGNDVVVHCVMGASRSGAVVEVGTWIGFEDPKDWANVHRMPNSVVMNMVANHLYDMDAL